MKSHATPPADLCDVLIVGAGPTGSLVAQRMAAQGMSVIVLEVGQRHRELTNTAANACKIMWNETRHFVGNDFVVPKAGMGIGGGTLPWLGVMPRFGRDDLRTQSTEGVGTDWQISDDDLRLHYERVEREFGVSGECGPFAPESYSPPMPPHQRLRPSYSMNLIRSGQLGDNDDSIKLNTPL